MTVSIGTKGKRGKTHNCNYFRRDTVQPRLRLDEGARHERRPEPARGAGRGLISQIRRAGSFGIAREDASPLAQSRCHEEAGTARSSFTLPTQA